MSEKNEFLDSPINKKFQNDNDSSLNNSNIQNMHENDDEIQSQPQVSESGKEKDVKPIQILKKPIPNDKNEIIKQLIERLNAAEDAINDAQNALIKEQEKRKLVMKELDEKSKTLNELIKSENESIQMKVQNEFKKTLNAAIAAKVQAENKKDELENMITEKNYLITEFDELILQSRKEYLDLNASYQFLATENYQTQTHLERVTAEKELLIQNNKQKDKTIEDLQNELSEAKGTMQKLSDVQNVLNRILGSQDLLNKKDQENLQKVRKQEPLLVLNNVQKNSNPEEEKIFLKNEDDFWYSNNDGNNDHEVKLELNMDQYLNKYQTQNNEVNKSTNSIRQMKANDQKTSLSIKK